MIGNGIIITYIFFTRPFDNKEHLFAKKTNSLLAALCQLLGDKYSRVLWVDVYIISLGPRVPHLRPTVDFTPMNLKNPIP